MGLEIEGFAPLLQVFDMPTSLVFYRDILGFEVVSASEPRRGDDVGWCMLRRDDVDGAYAYLRSRGVDADEPEVAYYGMKQLYFRDPDGYNLCFQWRVS